MRFSADWLGICLACCICGCSSQGEPAPARSDDAGASEASQPAAAETTRTGTAEPANSTSGEQPSKPGEGKNDPEKQPEPSTSPESTATDERESSARAAFARLVGAHHDENPEQWHAAEQELIELGKHSVGALIGGLRSADSPEREFAAMILAQLGADAAPAADALKERLTDESLYVRVNVASALSQLGDQAEHVVPALIELIGEDDINVRLPAVVVLGNFGSAAKEAVTVLIESLGDDDSQVRESAATTLGRIGHDAAAAVEALERLADDDAKDRVRTAATIALTQIKTGGEAEEKSP